MISLTIIIYIMRLYTIQFEIYQIVEASYPLLGCSVLIYLNLKEKLSKDQLHLAIYLLCFLFTITSLEDINNKSHPVTFLLLLLVDRGCNFLESLSLMKAPFKLLFNSIRMIYISIRLLFMFDYWDSECVAMLISMLILIYMKLFFEE